MIHVVMSPLYVSKWLSHPQQGSLGTKDHTLPTYKPLALSSTVIIQDRCSLLCHGA